MGGSLLLVEDDQEKRARFRNWLEASGWHVAAHESGRMALGALTTEEFDVMLVGAGIPDAPRVLEHAADARPDVPSALVGASDERQLETLIARTRGSHAGGYHLQRLPELASTASFEVLEGSSDLIQAVRRRLARLAPTDAPVLIAGETGTGKEVVARALHEASVRRSKPFVAVNCAALPTGLLESELFGHEQGAFTSAVGARDGLVAAADGGTLFLDEIQSLPLEAQPKLLRVVEDKHVRPIGGRREVPCDVRLLAATNVDLRGEVRRGHFRPDLMYRIDVLRVRLPPLRERPEDILEMAEQFLADAAERVGRAHMRLSPRAEEALRSYAWPGNVRELMHAMESAAALAQGPRVEPDDLPLDIRDAPPGRPGEGSPYGTLQAMRELYARRVLRHVGGNKKAAARILDISRQRLYRLLG